MFLHRRHSAWPYSCRHEPNRHIRPLFCPQGPFHTASLHSASSSLLPILLNQCLWFPPPPFFFLMAAQLDVLIKVEILNASHSQNTEWNMRLISHLGDEFLWAAGVFFFFLMLFLDPLGKSSRLPDSLNPSLVHGFMAAGHKRVLCQVLKR